MKKVSVIIPNYNHSLYLRQRIESVLAQTYTNVEIFILDDCSTDNSRSIISEYKEHPKISAIVFNDINSGSTFKQWKKGIDLTSGDYIWIAESDDSADPFFLETAISIFEQDYSIGLIQCQSHNYSSNNQIVGIFPVQNTSYDWECDFKEKGRDFIQNAMMFDNPLINASAIVFRKSAIKKNMLNTQFTLNGDWFFYLNILLDTDFYHIGKPLNYFRQHDNKGSSRNIQNFNNIKEYSDVISFLFANTNLTKIQKNSLRHSFLDKWLSQNDYSFKKLFSNYFISISGKGLRNDSLLFLRLIKMKLTH